MAVLLMWEEDDDGDLRVARTSEQLLGKVSFVLLGEGGHHEDQEKVKELKETAFLLLAYGLLGNGLLGSVAWNGQENACLRGA